MITVSTATQSDLPVIHQMIKDLSAYHGETALIGIETLKETLFGPRPMAEVLIARKEAQTVGYAGLTTTLILHLGQVRMDIHHLFICEAHRRCGVGTALIEAAKTRAREQNAARLTIGTDPENIQAVTAYRAMPDLTEIMDDGPRFSITFAA